MMVTNSDLAQKILNSSNLDWQNWLEEILVSFNCVTGTLHALNSETGLLELKGQVGIPAFLLPKMNVIPVGKGMAGIAAERMEAVQVCNLQTDESGVVRPGAKDTKVEGAITAPMILEGKLYGTLGIAMKDPYEFSEEETKALMEIAAALATKVKA
ncbi:GAF domain-containing protein [uncultured Cyclobacterium sp.]|uniref:GAF domain-containing protein n=1 Tax=uncultured Cyclobacterium sp. TaxID=453820 RepID=UPI0030EE0512|tara:strand:+ start:359920 stop:360387 length:468 start_codon:yes stop_codon:yes gene_type:complete